MAKKKRAEPSPRGGTRGGLRLRLYVAGNAPNSLRAIENLKSYCEHKLFDGHELEIVDLLKFPLRALADGIIVTPTLIKLAPSPLVRLIGSLADPAHVLGALGAR